MKGYISLSNSFLLVACLTQVFGSCNGLDESQGRLADCEGDLKKCQNQLYPDPKIEYDVIALVTAKGRFSNGAKDVDCQLQHCSTGNTALVDKVMEIAAEKNRVNEQITKLQDKIKNLDSAITSPAVECEKEKQELEKDKAILKERIDVLSDTISNLETKLSDCNKDKDICSANLLNITAVNEQCAKELQAITEADGRCEGLVTLLKEQITDFPLIIAECKDWLANNVTALNNCENILNSKTNDLNKCNDNLIACQEKSKELNEIFNLCREKLEFYVTKYEECNSLLEACKNEKKDYKDKYESAVNKCNDLAGGISLSFLSTGAYYFKLNLADKKTWFEANTFCGSHGWKLLKLDDVNENNVVSAEIIRLYGTTDKVFWISLNELNSEGTWSNFGWDNGAPYISWHAGEPDNNGGFDEDCVTIKLNNGLTSSLDYPCLDQSVGGFICEVPSPCADLLVQV